MGEAHYERIEIPKALFFELKDWIPANMWDHIFVIRTRLGLSSFISLPEKSTF